MTQQTQMFMCPCKRSGVNRATLSEYTRKKPYACDCGLWYLFEEEGYAQVMPAAVRPALCLDLDGTVRYSKSGDFINHVDDIAIFEDVEERLWEYRDDGWLILGVTNQAGVAFGHKTQIGFMDELDRMKNLFDRFPFHIIKGAFGHEDGTVFPYNHRTLLRKPDYGLLAVLEVECFNHGYIIDWDRSLFVGDRQEDRQVAENAGIRFLWDYEFFSGRPRRKG